MLLKFSNRGNNLIVTVIGELDHHSAEQLKNKVDSEIMKSSTKNVIFDFGKLGFMDSSGIGAIMGRFKNVQKLKGKLVIVNAGPQIRKILDMSGLLKIIDMYDSVEIALNKLM